MDFSDQDFMDLRAGISSAQLGRLHRRIRYLEAALVQVLRDESALREWFSSSEIVSFELPGLPRTVSGMTRHAKDNAWEKRIVMGPRGEQKEYHFTSLPARAFDIMLERVLRNPMQDQETASLVPNIPRTKSKPAVSSTGQATSQWLLPLMRILKKEPMPIGEAVLRLPPDFHTGRRPDLHEVVFELRQLGLIA